MQCVNDAKFTLISHYTFGSVHLWYFKWYFTTQTHQHQMQWKCCFNDVKFTSTSHCTCSGVHLWYFKWVFHNSNTSTSDAMEVLF